MTLMPVTRISASVDCSTNSGALRWIGRVCLLLTGPRSSTGSPITFRMRPSVSRPTGTSIGSPVSSTSWPRVRPSVPSMAIVRTVDSPRCCATSSTSRLPWLSVWSAFRIAGRWPSNWTSTTAPMTCVTWPAWMFSRLVAMAVPCCLLGARLEGLGAGDDLDQLSGDLRLGGAVGGQRQPVDHVPGVTRRAVHRGHAGALLAGRVLDERTVDLDREVARQQLLEDAGLARLELVDRLDALVRSLAVLDLARRYRDQLPEGQLLRDCRLEAVEDDRADIEGAVLIEPLQALGDGLGLGIFQPPAADALDGVLDQAAVVTAQGIAALAADAQQLDLLALLLKLADPAPGAARDRAVEA